jgi:hypothetical protein
MRDDQIGRPELERSVDGGYEVLASCLGGLEFGEGRAAHHDDR